LSYGYNTNASSPALKKIEHSSFYKSRNVLSHCAYDASITNPKTTLGRKFY
jgi:hypothetical protein